MITQLSTQQIPLTPAVAQTFATMNQWEGERPVREERVRMLLDKINSGLFHSPTWAFARLEGKIIRINGQHSSLALLKAPRFPQHLEATVLEFKVDSRADLAELFDQFDNPQSMRRLRDTIHAHLAVEGALADCPPNILQVILSGIAQGDGQANQSNAERAALMHSHQPFIAFARQLSGRRHLMYTAVIAAMYLSWKRDERRCQEFWNLVADESHVDSANATRALARFLRGEVVGRSARGGLRWDRRAVMVKCLHAWNAYWRRQTTSLKYTPSAPVPSLA